MLNDYRKEYGFSKVIVIIVAFIGVVAMSIGVYLITSDDDVNPSSRTTDKTTKINKGFKDRTKSVDNISLVENISTYSKDGIELFKYPTNWGKITLVEKNRYRSEEETVAEAILVFDSLGEVNSVEIYPTNDLHIATNQDTCIYGQDTKTWSFDEDQDEVISYRENDEDDYIASQQDLQCQPASQREYLGYTIYNFNDRWTCCQREWIDMNNGYIYAISINLGGLDYIPSKRGGIPPSQVGGASDRIEESFTAFVKTFIDVNKD